MGQSQGSRRFQMQELRISLWPDLAREGPGTISRATYPIAPTTLSNKHYPLSPGGHLSGQQLTRHPAEVGVGDQILVTFPWD